MMTTLKLGAAAPLALHVGGLAAPKAYLGSTLVWDKTTGGFGASESILTGTPDQGGQQSFKLGNTYQWAVAGQIVGARFWRPGSVMPGIETSHIVQLYNQAHALVTTSQPSTESPGNYTGWVEVPFMTPNPVAAGERWTTAVDLPMASMWSTTNFGVLHPASVTYVTSVYGTVNDPTFPANASTGFNFFVDAIWQPATATASPPDAAHLRVLFDALATSDLATWTNPYGAGWSIQAGPAHAAGMPVLQADGLAFDGTQSCRLTGPLATAIPTQATVYVAFVVRAIEPFNVLNDGGGAWTSYYGVGYPALLQTTRHETYRSDMPRAGDLTPHVLTYLANGTTYQVNLDSTPGPVVASKGYVPDRLGGAWVLGTSADGYGNFGGLVRAVLVYAARHDDAQQAAVRTWMTTELGT